MKDLCLTCKHNWSDFHTNLKESIPHVVDEKYGFVSMDEIVPYPCAKCPFNSYVQK